MQQQEQLIQRQAPRRLGASGIQVPALAIGTQTWGVKAWGYGTGYARDDLYAAYRAALDAGMTFLDTSDLRPLRGTDRRVPGAGRPGGGACHQILTLDLPRPL